MKNGQLYINGEPVKRKLVGQIDNPDITEVDRPVDVYRETLPNGVSLRYARSHADRLGDNTREFIVPPGHYFMMGDNRDNSTDSRFDVGFVPAENFVGTRRHHLLLDRRRRSPLEVWRWPANSCAGRACSPVID